MGTASHGAPPFRRHPDVSFELTAAAAVPSACEAALTARFYQRDRSMMHTVKQIADCCKSHLPQLING